MEKYQIMRLIFGLIQFGLFTAILTIQASKGPSDPDSVVNEWVRTVWTMAFSVLIVLGLFIHKLTEWVPYLGKGYKTAFLVMIMAAFGFRKYLGDGRSIIAFILLGIAFSFMIVSCIMEPPQLFERTEPKTKQSNAEATVTQQSQTTEVASDVERGQIPLKSRGYDGYDDKYQTDNVTYQPFDE